MKTPKNSMGAKTILIKTGTQDNSFLMMCNPFLIYLLHKINNDISPNVIIVLVDDLGYNDVGFNGSKEILTPNIDKLSKNGVTFSRGYVSYPVCSPSRAGLITGRSVSYTHLTLPTIA